MRQIIFTKGNEKVQKAFAQFQDALAAHPEDDDSAVIAETALKLLDDAQRSVGVIAASAGWECVSFGVLFAPLTATAPISAGTMLTEGVPISATVPLTGSQP